MERLGAVGTPQATDSLDAALRWRGHWRTSKTKGWASAPQLAASNTSVGRTGTVGLWNGDLDSLERLSVPAAETIERQDGEFRAAQQRLDGLDDQLAKAELRRVELDSQIEQLRLEGEVPDETELAEGRRRRDEGWWLLRAMDGMSAEICEAAFVAEFSPSGSLADAYEKALRIADDKVDRLRREADRVAARRNGRPASSQSCRARTARRIETPCPRTQHRRRTRLARPLASFGNRAVGAARDAGMARQAAIASA